MAYIKHLLEKKGKVGKLFAIAKEVKKEIDRIMKMFEERFADFSYLKTLEEC